MVGLTNVSSGKADLTAQPVLFFYGQQSSASTTPPSTRRRYACNSEYFTYADGEFTVVKKFSGLIYLFGLSSRNSSGQDNTLTLRFRVDGTSTYDTNGTINVTSSGSGIAHTFNVGDVVSVTGSQSRGGTVWCSVGMVVTLGS